MLLLRSEEYALHDRTADTEMPDIPVGLNSLRWAVVGLLFAVILGAFATWYDGTQRQQALVTQIEGLTLLAQETQRLVAEHIEMSEQQDETLRGFPGAGHAPQEAPPRQGTLRTPTGAGEDNRR